MGITDFAATKWTHQRIFLRKIKIHKICQKSSGDKSKLTKE